MQMILKEFYKHQNIIQWVWFSLAILAIVFFVIIVKFRTRKKRNLNNLTATAIFGGLSAVLYTLSFPIPLFPTFLKFQLSNIPAYIIGFSIDPISGFIVVLIRFLIKLPFTRTFVVGEAADFMIGALSVLASGYLYSKYRTFKGAIYSLVLGVIVWVMTAIIINKYILAPFYIKLFFNGNIYPFIGILEKATFIKNVNEMNYLDKYIYYAVIPFNFLLAAITTATTFLVYKSLSKYIRTEKRNRGADKLYDLLKIDRDI